MEIYVLTCSDPTINVIIYDYIEYIEYENQA